MPDPTTLHDPRAGETRAPVAPVDLRARRRAREEEAAEAPRPTETPTPPKAA